MIQVKATISGVKQYIAELVHFRKVGIKETLYGGTEESLRDVMSAMQQYPPESEANRPPYPYWSRGTGRIHASGNVNPVSQRYGDSWELEVRQTKDGAEGMLSNSASYAPWVGSRQSQAWFHRARGWPTIENEAEKRGLTTSKITVSSRIASRVRSAIENLKGRLQR